MSHNASSRTPRGKAAGIAPPLQGEGRAARPHHPGTPRSAAPKAGAPVRDLGRYASSKQFVAAERNGSARRPSIGPSPKPNSPPVATGAKAAPASSSAPSYSGPPGPSRDAALRARPKATHERNVEAISFSAARESPPASGRRGSGSLSMATSTGLVVSSNASSPRAPISMHSGILGGAPSSSDAADTVEREGATGTTPTSSPRRRQSEVPTTSTKPPPVKKRGNSSKKRRATGNSTTRPQPFSFSTDVRKGRRVRPNSVDEEMAQDDSVRPKSLNSRRGPKYSSIVQVPVPKRHASGTPLTPPDSGVSQGGASSSSDHWEPQSPGLPTSGSSPAVSPGVTEPSMPSSSSTSRLLAARLDGRPQPVLSLSGRDPNKHNSSGSHASHEDEEPSPGLPGQNYSHAGGSSSSSGRRHYSGPEKRASSRDVPPTRDSNASSTEDFWPFSPSPCSPVGSPQPPAASKLVDKRSTRRNRVTDLRNRQSYGSGAGQQPNGTPSASSVAAQPPSASSSAGSSAGAAAAAAEDASASVSDKAGAAALTGHHTQWEDEDRGGSQSRERSNSASGSLERNRSTSILRGRFNAHIRSAQAAAEAEERERHVSFCADRSNEVVHYVDEKGVPATTRVARRVFGGDLQAHMGNNTVNNVGRYQAGNTNASTGHAFDSANRNQPALPSNTTTNAQGAHMQSHVAAGMGSMSNSTMCGSRMPSVERLPTVAHTSELNRFKEGETRQNAFLRPGIRDLAPTSAETALAHV